MAELPELELLKPILPLIDELGHVTQLGEVQVKAERFPIYSLRLGPDDPSMPTFGLFGGVHGLERVGSHVVINYLIPLLKQLLWDRNLQRLFEEVRLVSIPIVNPGGMYLGQRSNPNGVDVMRNAPIEGREEGSPLVSGQNISPLLPWYRGEPHKEMELETQILVDFVKKELLPSRFALSLDIHSGFGMRDRIWYPYSRTSKAFPYTPFIQEFKSELKEVHPFHIYKIEPQTQSYVIHGDPWDYLFDLHERDPEKDKKFYVPFCLEMGSWTWLRKNPKQLFSRFGIFNPILPHRYKRIMRRHRGLLDFMKLVAFNHEEWRG